MNIAILGYGKMGRIIEEVAQSRGHNITLRVGREGFTADDLSQSDVAIDFSIPSTAFSNIKTCIESGTPVVSGTTGWLEKMSDVEELCRERNGSFLYASNFSLGVNLFFELNRNLAKLMDGHEVYSPSMTEIHHTQKLDAPSGTAITLAEDVIRQLKDLSDWKLVEGSEEASATELPIKAERVDPTPGTHIIAYDSEIDTIEIKHTAKSRKGFALGAVVAAEYLVKNPGIQTMKDVLGLN